MAATHHSQLNDAVFFPFSRFFSVGEGEGVEANRAGSFRVHNLQVGLSSTEGMFVDVCDALDRLGQEILYKWAHVDQVVVKELNKVFYISINKVKALFCVLFNFISLKVQMSRPNVVFVCLHQACVFMRTCLFARNLLWLSLPSAIPNPVWSFQFVFASVWVCFVRMHA